MHRLLIVDDEPLIVHGLVDFIAQQERWPLEVYGALSAEEALAMLDRHRMDIVISDIGMPEMDGLELQKRIVRRWPKCKIIFLTGFNDFDYVQEAMRHQGLDYVLKAEGDDAVVQALEKAIEQIKEDIRKEELILQADKQLKLAIPSLQKELLSHILQGDLHSVTRLDSLFGELNVPFASDAPVMMAMVRYDHFGRFHSIYDRSLLSYSIQNIAQEVLTNSVSLVSIELDRSRMMWFMQPCPDGEGGGLSVNDLPYAGGCLELIQQTCRELLDMPLSFIMKEIAVPWAEVGDLYEEYNRLLSRGLGMGSEFLWIYDETTAMPHEGRHTPFHSGQLRSRIDLMTLYFQNGQKDAFEGVLSDIVAEGGRFTADPSIQQEIYYSLVPMFLSQLNRLSGEEQRGLIDIGRLTGLGAHVSWNEAMEYLRKLSSSMFAESRGGMEREENVVVHKVQRYVQEHLGGDLSLVAIGDVIGHNSKYLSRLYKKATGEDLSAYISGTKLKKAQEMLKDTNMKIYEVSAAIGFLSEPYFYRFFRKATGMTPQDYRDLHGGGIHEHL
ncbi:response regulator transcription factor [Cohnella phaseoli]|uniref:Two-component system response regulator YesN n=1 Tax=Cohnella phaseoli TaxID=456490 RepID=A0A3D9JRZ9_9BACL|nr:response regulator [Cohnella phaseoli]RED76818.1 two-component system response regulator YesN [Cohnella phaseoli]